MSDPVWPGLMEGAFIAGACALTGLLGGALWVLWKQMQAEERREREGKN